MLRLRNSERCQKPAWKTEEQVLEQAKRKCAHIERILLICGNQDAGKSQLIRHMFSDKRLAQAIPSMRGPISTIPLSRERCLAGRSTSPHEMNETPAKFHEKIDKAAKSAWNEGYWRINYVSAIQPQAYNYMLGIVETCNALNKEFWPERIRVVQLAPDQWGNGTSKLTPAEVDGLRQLDVEVITIDARRSAKPAEPGNIRVLADFFDFS